MNEKMGTATFVKRCEGMRGDARVYRLDPPMGEVEFVVVSAVMVETFFPAGEMPETYIFPADETGEILNFGELSGSQKGTLQHATALQSAGYEIAE